MLGPICFGQLVDDICIHWEKTQCGETGSCQLYDNDKFRLKLYGYELLFKVIGLAFMLLSLVMAKVTKFNDDSLGGDDTDVELREQSSVE